MSADQHILFRQFSATKFCNDVRGLDGAAKLVAHRDSHLHGLCGLEQSSDSSCVFMSDENTGNSIELAWLRIDVAIEDVELATRLPGYAGRVPAERSLDDR